MTPARACPFCGSTDLAFGAECDGCDEYTLCAVSCDSCGARGPRVRDPRLRGADAERAAWDMWNASGPHAL